MRIEYMSFIISYLSKIRVALVVLLIKKEEIDRMASAFDHDDLQRALRY